MLATLCIVALHTPCWPIGSPCQSGGLRGVIRTPGDWQEFTVPLVKPLQDGPSAVLTTLFLSFVPHPDHPIPADAYLDIAVVDDLNGIAACYLRKVSERKAENEGSR